MKEAGRPQEQIACAKPQAVKASGQILSVRVSSDGEQAVRIVPGEVFLGHPGRLLHVMTSQGDYLPNLSTGARWLFYLRLPEKGPIVLDYYGNDSLPVTAAKDQIETLRRLKTMNASGLIKGRIDLRAGVQGLHVTATDNRNQARFQTTVHQDGGFEFPPLMPGQYTLSVTDPPADHIDNAEVDLKAGACLNQTLSRHPHGEIGGRISKADHSAARNVDVVLLNADATGYITTQTDENGRYHFDGLESGRFIVGLIVPPGKLVQRFWGRTRNPAAARFVLLPRSTGSLQSSHYRSSRRSTA